jgi:cytochrome c oxidase cbb3-type subunit 4
MIDYDTIAHLIKLGGTVVFFVFFACVIAYALWPKNKSRFQSAAQIPLADSDQPEI